VRPREATTQAALTHRDVAGGASARSAPGPLRAAELESVPFDLRRMIEATAEPVLAAAGDKGLVLEVKTAEALPGRVVGPAPTVRQVLSSLLENAVKFTERGEVVASISAHETGSGRVLVHFEISDTGPGIPPPALERRDAGGLAEARQLVEAMDGRMECASAIGFGSTLWFSVPLDLLG
jgi:signal transduction histidine kinase